jgi:hypothetical protein
MQYDVWAVSPESDDDFFFASATISATGSISLLANNIGYNGTGYQVSITSDGADADKTFTITGVKVGAVGYDGIVSEVVTGPSASVTYSANYYTSIQSISVSAGSAGNVKIGYGGDLAFPRTRIKGVYFVSNGSNGSIVFTAKPNDTVLLNLAVPSGTLSQDMMIPGEGILTTKSNSGRGDFAVMTLTNLTHATVICG